MKLGSLEQIRALLAEVFHDSRYRTGYLEWLYRANPEGNEISAYHEVDGRYRAHYVVIPQIWSNGDRLCKLALSLDSAVATECRGIGLFTELAKQVYAKASAVGIAAIVGVGNANSTHGLINKLGFAFVRPLPVSLTFVLPIKTGAQTIFATDDWLAGPEFKRLAESVGAIPGGWARMWTPECLRWRLSSPLGPYHLHLTPDGLAISRRIVQVGLPFAAILKILPRGRTKKVDTAPLLRAAAYAQDTPLVVYAGWNAAAQVRGVSVPRVLLPRPLNLCFRQLALTSPALDQQLPSAFEFLDFDAY